MEKLVLYPSEYGKSRTVDRDYEFEKALTDKFGVYTALLNYDEFTCMGKSPKLTFLTDIPKEPVEGIYRGWMLKPEQYEQLYEVCKLCNIKLINNVEEYKNAHWFHKAYDKISSYTPMIAVFSDDDIIEWIEVRDYFSGKFMIKDYVKSVKGYDYPEWLDFTYTDKQLDEMVAKFKELRGDLYSGGIILKEYVNLKKTSGKTHEFRGFYYKGRLVALYHNSDNNEDDLSAVRKFAESIPKLDSNFYTVDFAYRNDDKLIVIECGDGQVSGIPSLVEAEALHERLFNR